MTPTELGDTIRRTRRALNLTQKDLALTSGTGLRFIIELERGKPTSQLGKTLIVLSVLGIAVTLMPPEGVRARKAKLSGTTDGS